MFGSTVLRSVVVSIDYDPDSDEVYALWRAPQALEVIAAYATVVNDVAAATDNYFEVCLRNGGTIGTATTSMGGTVGGTVGWTGLTPKAFTISDGTMSAGQIATLSYNEEGTGTFTNMVIQIDYRLGEID